MVAWPAMIKVTNPNASVMMRRVCSPRRWPTSIPALPPMTTVATLATVPTPMNISRSYPWNPNSVTRQCDMTVRHDRVAGQGGMTVSHGGDQPRRGSRSAMTVSGRYARVVDRILLIDGHSVAYRAFFALPVENFATSTGQHTNAR